MIAQAGSDGDVLKMPIVNKRRWHQVATHSDAAAHTDVDAEADKVQVFMFYIIVFHHCVWLLYPPSERSETGGYTVFTFVCLSVCLCICLCTLWTE